MFTIQLNHKFGAVILYRAWVRNALPDEVALGGELWVVRKLPFPVPDNWREWLGSIQCRQIEESNLLVVSTRASKNPDIVDHENRTLSSRAQRLFRTLLLLGPLKYENGFLVTGTNRSGVVDIRQFGPLDLSF